MENTEYLLNFSYIFIPFCLQKETDFCKFNEDLMKRNTWLPVKDDVRYLYRYVADRLVNEKKSTCNLYHYRLNEKVAKKMDLWLNSRYYRTKPKTFRDKEGAAFNFFISDVQLFSFNTSICILAFQLQFRKTDPFYIAAAQYHLRKIQRESIYVTEPDGTETAQTFIGLSRKLLGSLVSDYSLDFFFYTSEKNERANFLTYIDLPAQENYDRELFYLKWCYHDRFQYAEDGTEEDCTNYTINSDTFWGISSSAAVCIVNRTEKTKEFFKSVFQTNFQKQYLLTYVLLLHQKYMLYWLLTKLSIDVEDDVDQLANHKRRLHAFDSKYVFIKITEVPQYQRFYEKVMRAFSIKEMFSDVEEPLSQLAEIQRLSYEERQQKHDHSINATLMILSCLTIVSAITDALAITSELQWLIPENVSRIVQLSVASVVLLLSVIMVIRLFFIKNKH